MWELKIGLTSVLSVLGLGYWDFFGAWPWEFKLAFPGSLRSRAAVIRTIIYPIAKWHIILMMGSYIDVGFRVYRVSGFRVKFRLG